MTREEKIEIIADILEMDDEIIKEDTILEELETWDSVAVLAVISVINEKFDRYPTAEEIKTYKTVQDLMNAFE
ncbi:MAG: acyl carrier protein [Eubacterium sp.]|jgi:Phosphopantetheine attachment site.|nr:acyl carrier protein [Eubacterium sp.]MCI9537031.1 acyl carrier protein [Eubacterium sp.]